MCMLKHQKVDTKDYGSTPWNAIGLLGNEGGSGTGFLIHGSVVVTAAHVLWDSRNKRSNGRQSFFRCFDDKYNSKVTPIHAREKSLAKYASGATQDEVSAFNNVGFGGWVHPLYLSEGHPGYDLGFVVLENPVPNVAPLEIEEGVNPDAAYKWQIRIPGYPVALSQGNKEYYQVQGREEREASALARKAGYKSYSLWNYDSAAGLSGAPLCRAAPLDQVSHVVGIHTAAFKDGLKIALLFTDELRKSLESAVRAALG